MRDTIKRKTKANMSRQGYLLLGFLALINFLAHTHGVIAGSNFSYINRSSFPAGFIFGTASSAYQYEGAVKEGGKGPSIWDTFTHKYPDKIRDGSNGDVAVDFYHRYKEDVAIMKKMGMDAFRFSISWSRILPRGTLSGGVSKEGIAFYNNTINELLSKGIKPFVTIFHWDVPQALEDEYGGFLSPNIINDFRDYAELCYREFGDRVKHWITLNEPYVFCNMGYAVGMAAPGRCSSWINENCTGGDSATEPYTVGHHLLLAHAAAVKVYKEKYQVSQKGKIGITLSSPWIVPYSNEKVDKHAARRSIDFNYGWFMSPLTYGYYPRNLRNLVGKRLPRFTKEEAVRVKGSFDFIGLNYYTSNYAAHSPNSNAVNVSFLTDAQANTTSERNGIFIGSPSGVAWLYSYPEGFRELLLYTKRRYKNPTIYITENGICEFNNNTLSLKEQLNDTMRINYFHDHLSFLLLSIKEGVDVRGYFAWSLLDDFEWSSGYTIRFGSYYVDYENGLKRYPKLSAFWFKKFLQG